MREDQLFATLDPTMRGLRLPSGRRVILSDTVGFISELPTELVAAFRATLEEVAEADVILHVRDAAHPDSAAQRADVLAVLDGMVQDGTLDAAWPDRTIEVLNKADLLGGVAAGRGARRAASPFRRSPARGSTGCATRSTRGSRPGMEVADYDIPPRRRRPARLALPSTARWSGARTARSAIHVTVRLLPADRARFEREQGRDDLTSFGRQELAELDAAAARRPRADRDHAALPPARRGRRSRPRPGRSTW